LESDLLESILEIAISTVEHLVQMWLLEPQRRPHPLLCSLLFLLSEMHWRQLVRKKRLTESRMKELE
jgi:hypothetical protein